MATKTYVITGTPRWVPITPPYDLIGLLDSVGDEVDFDLDADTEATLIGSGVLAVKVVPHLRLY